MKSNALLIIILIVIVAIVGVYFGYNMFFNKSNLINVFNTNNYQNIPITIYNTQNISTPSPFQQQVAICNGDLSEDFNFAYVNNARLFDQINPNGQNVYFVDSSGNILYSWYAGQSIYYYDDSSAKCYVWWIKLPNGIPANSNITIYMYIGPNNTNYYQQYYPYVGASPDVDPSRKYDNGKYVFIVYGYFNNTFDGWTAYVYNGTFTPTETPYGIQMLNNQTYEGTYILPPNNGNIPKIPLIVEEVWSSTEYNIEGGIVNIIALFGNTNQQSNTELGVPVPNLSTFVQFNFEGRKMVLKSAVTNQDLNYTEFLPLGGTMYTFYSYLIVNSSYAQAGYDIYSYTQEQAPLTILNTYEMIYAYESDTYYNLNYNPFQYGTLQISAGDGADTSYQYIQWVVARAYPPNGVMPRTYID
jgi:hypothetical protein